MVVRDVGKGRWTAQISFKAVKKAIVKILSKGWGCSAVVKHLPSIREALISIPSTTKKATVSKSKMEGNIFNLIKGTCGKKLQWLSQWCSIKYCVSNIRTTKERMVYSYHFYAVLLATTDLFTVSMFAFSRMP